jgi:GAF domain-containing protein
MTNGMRIENAEQRIARLETQVTLWQAEHERAATNEQELRVQVAALRADNRRLAELEAAASQRMGRLAQLLASALQLHAALLPADVLTVIKEIVANMIGSEEMGIFARRADGLLVPLDGIGDDVAALGLIHAAALRDCMAAGKTLLGDQPAACVPLLMDGRAMGVIAVFRLLPQKPTLDEGDLELFELLATHAGLALHHAELREGAAA